jgi:hypothetical protein
MKIKIEVTPDGIGYVLADMSYANRVYEKGGTDVFSPSTVKLLQNVLAAAEEKAAAMVQEGSEFSEVFGGWDGEATQAADAGETGEGGGQEETDGGRGD